MEAGGGCQAENSQGELWIHSYSPLIVPRVHHHIPKIKLATNIVIKTLYVVAWVSPCIVLRFLLAVAELQNIDKL